MKANELRLGNLISNMYEKTARVREIHEHPLWAGGFLVITDKNRSAIVTLRPIPLTAEWLEKFGFAEGNKRCAYLNLPGDEGESLPFFYVNNRMEVEYVQLMDSMEENEIKRIEYVHQLQNLYFALTGEELTIKS